MSPPSRPRPARPPPGGRADEVPPGRYDDAGPWHRRAVAAGCDTWHVGEAARHGRATFWTPVRPPSATGELDRDSPYGGPRAMAIEQQAGPTDAAAGSAGEDDRSRTER